MSSAAGKIAKKKASKNVQVKDQPDSVKPDGETFIFRWEIFIIVAVKCDLSF